MTPEQRRLIHRAWWRFLVLAVVGGAIAFGLGCFLLGLAFDEEIAFWLALLPYLLAIYYSFRESVRALLYDLEALQPAEAADGPSGRS